MALTVRLPEANHFIDEHGIIYLLDNPSGASELVFETLEDSSLRVKKSSRTFQDMESTQ